jgi:hypothetical protein
MQHHEQQVGGFLGAESVRLAVTDKFVAHPGRIPFWIFLHASGIVSNPISVPTPGAPGNRS